MQLLLGLLYQHVGVVGPGEIDRDVAAGLVDCLGPVDEEIFKSGSGLRWSSLVVKMSGIMVLNAEM